jgi:hypothetical protein
MRWRWCVLIVLLCGVRASGQGVAPVWIDQPPLAYPGTCPAPAPAIDWAAAQAPAQEDLLAGNKHFSNFIGWMSNPLQNVDPRALTQVVPIFASAWVSHGPALPDLDAQVYGPAISLALGERLSVGVNQGGYTFIHVDRNDRRAPLLNRLARTRGQEFGGRREGFLNLGGYAQYTVIEDVESQFLATVGVRLVVPCGSPEVFQGKGPTQMVPSFTAGKELGDFHVLMTGGYQFPLHNGDRDLEVFNLNAHVDRQFFGWVYPLVEANWNYHDASVPITLPTRVGFIDFGNFSSTGNTLTVAAGVNLVLIRDRLEFGGVYVRSVATQHGLDVDALIVKLVLRY